MRPVYLFIAKIWPTITIVFSRPGENGTPEPGPRVARWHTAHWPRPPKFPGRSHAARHDSRTAWRLLTVTDAFANARRADRPARATSSQPIIFEIRHDQPHLAGALDVLVKTIEQRRKAGLQETVCKDSLRPWADEQLAALVSATPGTPGLPADPIRILDPSTGNAVAYIVQDRCGVARLTDDQSFDLEAIVGSTVVDGLVCEHTTYSFAPEVLDQPAGDGRSVRDVLGQALGTLLAHLVSTRQITAEQARQLLIVEAERRLVPDAVSRCIAALPRDEHLKQSLLELFDALGPHLTRYFRT